MQRQPNRKPFALGGRSALVAACLGLSSANADSTPNILDTPGEFTTKNGGVFTVVNKPEKPAGTGVFGPFLTLKTQGNARFEEGYNTTLPPGANWTYDDAKDPTTTNIKVGDLVKDTGSGVPANYFIFDLDLNEPGAGQQNKPESLLALTDLKIWLDSRPSLNIPISGFDPSRLVYDLDGAGATAVIFKDLGTGSGSSDATFFLPAASLQNLGGVTVDDYVYFYARFGPAGELGDEADSGFEEWRIDTGNYVKVEPTDVPEPHEYALLAGLGLIGFGVIRRLRR